MRFALFSDLQNFDPTEKRISELHQLTIMSSLLTTKSLQYLCLKKLASLQFDHKIPFYLPEHLVESGESIFKMKHKALLMEGLCRFFKRAMGGEGRFRGFCYRRLSNTTPAHFCIRCGLRYIRRHTTKGNGDRFEGRGALVDRFKSTRALAHTQNFLFNMHYDVEWIGDW